MLNLPANLDPKFYFHPLSLLIMHNPAFKWHSSSPRFKLCVIDFSLLKLGCLVKMTPFSQNALCAELVQKQGPSLLFGLILLGFSVRENYPNNKKKIINCSLHTCMHTCASAIPDILQCFTRINCQMHQNKSALYLKTLLFLFCLMTSSNNVIYLDKAHYLRCKEVKTQATTSTSTKRTRDIRDMFASVAAKKRATETVPAVYTADGSVVTLD